MSREHDERARPASSAHARAAGRAAEAGDGVLDLQRLAGNRAVTSYIGAGAPLQRERMTAAEKEQRLRGLQQIPRTEVTATGLKTALGQTWSKYAALDAASAKEKCKVAVTEISQRLATKGIAHDYLGVVWWPSWGPGSLNHYALVAQGMVIDATGQQFPGGEADVTPFSTWLSGVRSRIPPRILGRYVRGDYQEAKTLAGIGMETYFDMEQLGEPLHDYDPAYVARVRRAVQARAAL